MVSFFEWETDTDAVQRQSLFKRMRVEKMTMMVRMR